MLDSHYYIIIELGICALITLGLLLYYVRKNVNILVFFTAYIAWLFNFALIVFLPFDIYYTQIATDSNIEMPEMTRKIIEYGYTITYWTLFIFSWIFIPLMQCYESSGEFTKLAKLKSSLKENIIYYSILALISIAILIFAIIKTGFEYTLELAKDCSLIIGILFFFFLLSYSLVKYPKTLYQKLNYINQIKYHEWRANQFFEKLDEIKFDLINRFLRLRITIQNLKDEENNKKESINTSIITEKSNKRKDNSSLSMELSLSDKTKQLTGYLEFMENKYNDFSENCSKYGIALSKENVDGQKLITELKDLIELNRKINKKLNDNLRMQCRLRNCYKRWAILNTLLFFNKITDKNEDEKKDTIKENNNDEKIIVKSEKQLSLKEEGFIPLEDFSNCYIFYYTKIRKIFLFFLLILSIIAGLITIICEILMLFKFDLIFRILGKINNIIILHFVILIPLIYLIWMSNYTLFKIKISSYIYMYGHRQTDSVSLMIFSSYLSRIYFAICLNCLQAINQFTKDKKSKFEEFFDISQTEGEDNLIIKLCRLSPCVLIFFMILFFFNVPGKIGNLVGFNLFEFESEERDLGIRDGHRYLMILNKKLNGKKLERKNSKIFEDR
jgi:hypothetical protein